MIRNFQSYYDERKALKEILKDKNIFNKTKSFLIQNFSFEKYDNKIPIIGDGIYSNSNELIDITIKKELLPIFKIKKSLHNEIKSNQRLLVKKIYKEYKDTLFKQRFNIEGFFGNIKNKYNCYVNAEKFEVAKILVYVKFLAYLLVVFFVYIFYFILIFSFFK